MEPTQEYGWRMLAGDETRIAGDEYFAASRWMVCELSIGARQKTLSTRARRRIDPGEGWEIIPESERLESAQESTWDGVNWIRHTWNAVQPTAIEAMRQCNEGKSSPMVLAFRRRIKHEWIDIKSKTPLIGMRVWISRPLHGVTLCRSYNPGIQQITHWRHVKPGEIPEPPKAPEPVKTQLELDRESSQAWYKSHSDNEDLLCEKALRSAYEAGLKAGRAVK